MRHADRPATAVVRTMSVLALVSMLASVPGTAESSEPTAAAGPHLSGKIVDRAGRPVEGALIELHDQSVRSDADGRYALAAAAGTVTITRAPFETVQVDWDGRADRLLVTLVPRLVRALHVTGDAAGSDSTWNHLLEIADRTAVNSLEIDLKAEASTVYSKTPSGVADEIGATREKFDLAARTAEAHEHGLYVISRIVTFQDSIAGAVHPEWTSWDTRTGAPFTRRGLLFLDPWDTGARTYALTLAVDACEMGVDEVQLDYVRFLDGDKEAIRFDGPADAAGRTEAIRSFLEMVHDRLAPMGCALAADVFGFIVSKSHDGDIGQQLETIARHLDVVSPMVYPSHYVSGWFGLAVPNDHPAIVVDGALDDALSRLDGAPALRPWLQDFSYTASQVRIEIDRAEAHGVGWMMWNPYSNFTDSAYPSDGAVAEKPAAEPPSYEPMPPSGFYDVPGEHLFSSDITWLAATGVTRGCNPPYRDEFCPERAVTRAEMAAFLARALGLTAPASFDRFVDEDGSPFEPDIEALAAAGVTRGCNPPLNDRFCPERPISRAEMAAFLVRALDLGAGASGTTFSDVQGSTFAGDIDRLAAAGITAGCNPPLNDLYCPGRPVTRMQMAAFLHRALG